MGVRARTRSGEGEGETRRETRWCVPSLQGVCVCVVERRDTHPHLNKTLADVQDGCPCQPFGLHPFSGW